MIEKHSRARRSCFLPPQVRHGLVDTAFSSTEEPRAALRRTRGRHANRAAAVHDRIDSDALDTASNMGRNSDSVDDSCSTVHTDTDDRRRTDPARSGR